MFHCQEVISKAKNTGSVMMLLLLSPRPVLEQQPSTTKSLVCSPEHIFPIYQIQITTDKTFVTKTWHIFSCFNFSLHYIRQLFKCSRHPPPSHLPIQSVHIPMKNILFKHYSEKMQIWRNSIEREEQKKKRKSCTQLLDLSHSLW